MGRSSEQRKRKQLKENITALYAAGKYEDCLKLFDDNLLKDLQFYSMKVYALADLNRFEELLVLQKRLKEFGHERTLRYGVWLMFADANRMLNNDLEAYFLYQRVYGGASGDVEALSECLKYMEELKPKVQPDLDRMAEERATKFLEEEHVAASTSTIVSSTSTVVSSTSTVVSSTSTVAASTGIASTSAETGSSSIMSGLYSWSDPPPPQVMKISCVATRGPMNEFYV